MVKALTFRLSWEPDDFAIGSKTAAVTIIVASPSIPSFADFGRGLVNMCFIRLVRAFFDSTTPTSLRLKWGFEKAISAMSISVLL